MCPASHPAVKAGHHCGRCGTPIIRIPTTFHPAVKAEHHCGTSSATPVITLHMFSPGIHSRAPLRPVLQRAWLRRPIGCHPASTAGAPLQPDGAGVPAAAGPDRCHPALTAGHHCGEEGESARDVLMQWHQASTAGHHCGTKPVSRMPYSRFGFTWPHSRGTTRPGGNRGGPEPSPGPHGRAPLRRGYSAAMSNPCSSFARLPLRQVDQAGLER